MSERKAKISNPETVREANRYFMTKVLFNVFLIFFGAILIGTFLTQMQAKTAMVKQEENSRLALEEAVSAMDSNVQNADVLSAIFHDGNQDELDDICQLFSSGLFESMADVSNKERSRVFGDMVERSGVQYLFLMSMDGRIVLSSRADLYGVNPASMSLMTQENINQLLKGTKRKNGTVKPVTVKNRYGTFYFYSMPYHYRGNTYILSLGTEASVLDVQISSLTDVSVVLSRIAIGNNGFVFAVNKEDGTFLYYKNGNEVLTGQKALSTGLSEEALEDGYSGIQTINGVSYYCVSKDYKGKTVISAVARTDKIYNHDKYVLFWTITGFVLIMLICLAYTVIVRNDFVRHEVMTERVVLNRNPDNKLFFDRSIFNKVIPLVIAGTLVMFGISFYTQTLLEITNGIERSDLAIDEVSGRYEESQTNRGLIKNYYDTRFLSKARLISFLIEEDPSVLNASTEHYHNYYNDDGSKQFVKDDEGNRLKSVASSARLQELCDANDIDSVYIFDEEGHTIGTNTANWFFTISHNEEDQSYPFLEVLDGKADSLVQEAMENDLGETAQYIGVAFNYYTRKNADGDTEYISSYEYEQGGRSEDITAHRSMLQIGLNSEVSGKLFESTDVGSILSTNMLNDGFIVMFDSSKDHRCVYSPNEPSIGKKASTLGVSSKAFSGDKYYGFVNVGGTDYFSCFRYNEGYFIGTAFPEKDMYRARFIIALITSIICFLLITILTGTVTLTNEHEERLYATMTAEQAEKGMNSPIFNIILPSGRSTSTVQAAARWDNRRILWSDKSPEQKLITMITAVTALLLFYVLITIAGADRIFGESSIIRYILSGAWDRGNNIFAWTSCALVFLTIIIGVELFRIPVRITTSLLGARGETVGHLLLSVVKYGGAIGGLFYCLYLLGIDSSKLLASAGILSLIIGLGAQSLIKDIIAGIFIVFEGDFRVGDIVTIANYRGTVMDIGLRTTKILGADGNIKIYNNSEISGILNMTQEASYAICTIDIEYGQDLEYVEEVLNRELPLLKKKSHALIDVSLLGVTELGDSGVTLSVMGKCNEKDILAVRRFLNRELLLIFYRNGINVPFPNITFSALDTNGRKNIEDLMKQDNEKKDKKEKDEKNKKKGD